MALLARAYLVLFEKTEVAALVRLAALLMVAPVDGIAHGRHDGKCVL